MIKTNSSYETEFDSDVMTVKLKGEIDHHSAVILRQGIDMLLYERRPKRAILDLSGVDFMDSSGLGLIMGRYSVQNELGGEMVVRNPAPGVLRVMELAGIERLIKIEKKKVSDKK